MANLLEAIGNTPLVELTNINTENPRVKIFAKLEGCNPGGSVKDRPAYYMIKNAEENGRLTGKETIVEPTSGNTGIALAMIGASKGYTVKLFMPECVSVERRRILEALGVQVVLTPSDEGTDGAIRAAHRYLEENPENSFMPNQFKNEDNVLSHYETTGPEILKQVGEEGEEISIFATGMGTTGTLMGVAKYLRENVFGVKIVGIEPSKGHSIQGLKNMNESIVPEIYRPRELDEKIVVNDDDAFEMTRKLAMKEGLFVGMSSGAAVAGVMRIVKTMNSGVIVTVLPDGGDRYLSTRLFTSICGECPP